MDEATARNLAVMRLMQEAGMQPDAGEAEALAHGVPMGSALGKYDTGSQEASFHQLALLAKAILDAGEGRVGLENLFQFSSPNALVSDHAISPSALPLGQLSSESAMRDIRDEVMTEPYLLKMMEQFR